MGLVPDTTYRYTMDAMAYILLPYGKRYTL